MLNFVMSILFWVFLTATSVMFFPIAVLLWVVTSPFDKRKVLLHRFTSFWASLYTWLNPVWNVTVMGKEKIPKDEACVIVANHLSLLDILVMFRLFSHFKWVSKQENFRVPFVGWNMRLNDYIELKRGNRPSIIQMMRRCEETLALGSSIMMFPEGTRSPSGRLRNFKTGAFEIALRCRRPILPIVIRGTHNALPKAGFVLQGRHPIQIQVLDPIPFEEFEMTGVEELAKQVRERIAGELDGETSSD